VIGLSTILIFLASNRNVDKTLQNYEMKITFALQKSSKHEAINSSNLQTKNACMATKATDYERQKPQPNNFNTVRSENQHNFLQK